MKVTTMRAHPNKEKLEHTLSMITIADSWLSVSAVTDILIIDYWKFLGKLSFESSRDVEADNVILAKIR